MKITHTIIRNGISRGIFEGTKVPEKPLICPKEVLCRGNESCVCEDSQKEYDDAIQALWDSSVEWEDQRMIKSWLPDEAFTNSADDECVTVDGIYPLEGVNADIALQWFYQAREWVDCPQKFKDKNPELKFRNILRLIPQPNSEQKKEPEWTTPDAMEGRMGRTIKHDNFKPTIMEQMIIYVNGIRFFTEKSGLSKEEICAFVKAPVSNSTVSYQDGDNIATFPVSVKNMDHFQIIRNQVGGVSEGEPNQEQLMVKLIQQAYELMCNDESIETNAKVLLLEYHIQKLKP